MEILNKYFQSEYLVNYLKLTGLLDNCSCSQDLQSSWVDLGQREGVEENTGSFPSFPLFSSAS